MEAEATAEGTKLEMEAQSKGKKAEAKKMLQVAEHLVLSQSAQGLGKETPEWLSEAMAEWLGRHRLETYSEEYGGL